MLLAVVFNVVFVCVCMLVCACTCGHMCVHACVVCVHMCACMCCVCTYVCMHMLCVHVLCMCVHVCVCLHVLCVCMCVCVFSASAYAERLRLGLAVIHGEPKNMLESDEMEEDGRSSPPPSEELTHQRGRDQHIFLSYPTLCPVLCHGVLHTRREIFEQAFYRPSW